AVDLRGRPRLGAGTGVACGIARGFAAVDPEEQWPDIDGLAATVASGELLERVAAEVGPLEPVSTTGEAVGPGE
ncbi:MAG TPA: hypothetical protein VK276_07625, partial [Rubrobacteraceae bacterium]|nr:hypothetical protein [Rubrobacteraceae bacterium]